MLSATFLVAVIETPISRLARRTTRTSCRSSPVGSYSWNSSGRLTEFSTWSIAPCSEMFLMVQSTVQVPRANRILPALRTRRRNPVLFSTIISPALVRGYSQMMCQRKSDLIVRCPLFFVCRVLIWCKCTMNTHLDSEAALPQFSVPVGGADSTLAESSISSLARPRGQFLGSLEACFAKAALPVGVQRD